MSEEEVAETGWSIDLAEGWEGHDDGDTSVFTDPDGVGVLQITAMESDDEISEQDLKTFAGEPPKKAVRENFRNKDFRGFSIALQADGEYRHTWYLAAGKLAVVVSYVCNDEDRSIEMPQVKEMVRSLELIL
ncbi:MAG: hypothetical protein V2I38_00920 [Alcanivoracaceae bacterium]|jgi:hypothetical protein|nr:hypothetical protein [Alcanivoracaceae bacterium]